MIDSPRTDSGPTDARSADSPRRRRSALAAALLTAALVVGGAVASTAASAAADRVDVTWTTTNSWTTGFQASVDVANGSTTKLSPWQVRFTFPHTLVSIWSAVQQPSEAGTLTVGAPSWATTLTPGAKTNFGLTATKAGAAAIVPTGCTIVGLPAGTSVPCSVNGGPVGGGSTSGPTAPTPTPTPTVTTTPTPTPTPTPTLTPTLTPTPTPTSAGLQVTWSTTSEWTAGFQSAVRVRNTSGTALNPWRLSFTTGTTVVSLWDGTAGAAPDGFTVAAPSYATSLPAGGEVSFGLTSNKAAGAGLVPTACRVVGADLPCTINGSTSTPEPTPTPTPTPIPTPTPTIPAPSGPLVVAPYVDLGLWPTADLTAFSRASGVSAVTAAFVVADRSSACSPTWAGYTAYAIGGSQDFQPNIAAFQAADGRVVASFGGAVNDELARVCTDPAKVLAAYTTVVTRFGLDRVDFDIEGADVSDSAANQRRATAVATLQKQRAAAGHPLEVTLTLPVMPYGLLDSGLRTIREFTAAGVQLSAVNLMTMDYGTGVTDMAKAAIDAATATATQLKTVSAFAGLSDAQRRALVSVTPMIGVNDTGEVFTLANATTVAAFAKANGLAGLGWWELTRDQPCTGGIPAYMCTGTSAARWSYSKAFVAAAR